MASDSITRFSEILLPKLPPFNTYDIEEAFGPLSLVNIFVGANNSGKSRFLRGLFALNDYSFNTNKLDLKPIREVVSEIRSSFIDSFEGYSQIGAIRGDVFTYNDVDIRYRNPKNKVIEDIIQ